MVKANAMDMTDSEIINLLSEYNFKEKEMSVILKELKKRDFESVIEHIENIKADLNVDKEREKSLEAAKEREDEIRKEAAFKQQYKDRLIKKIQANREEQIKRIELENKNDKPIEKTIKIDAYIRVKAVIDGKEEIIFGCDKESSMSDLYTKIKTNTGSSNIIIRRFGHAEEILSSDKKVFDVFRARSIMIEVTYK